MSDGVHLLMNRITSARDSPNGKPCGKGWVAWDWVGSFLASRAPVSSATPGPIRRFWKGWRPRALIRAALAGWYAVAASGCAVKGGRWYPVVGLGYIIVPTNAVTVGPAVSASGSRLTGLVAGVSGPVTGLAIGRVEALSLSVPPDTDGLAEARLDRDGFYLRLEGISEPTIPTHPNHP